MSPRPDATLLFPKHHDDEPSTRSLEGDTAPISSVPAPRSTNGVLGAFVLRHSSEPPVQVYERAAPSAFDWPPPPARRAERRDDTFQKVR